MSLFVSIVTKVAKRLVPISDTDDYLAHFLSNKMWRNIKYTPSEILSFFKLSAAPLPAEQFGPVFCDEEFKPFTLKPIISLTVDTVDKEEKKDSAEQENEIYVDKIPELALNKKQQVPEPVKEPEHPPDQFATTEYNEEGISVPIFAPIKKIGEGFQAPIREKTVDPEKVQLDKEIAKRRIQALKEMFKNDSSSEDDWMEEKPKKVVKKIKKIKDGKIVTKVIKKSGKKHEKHEEAKNASQETKATEKVKSNVEEKREPVKEEKKEE